MRLPSIDKVAFLLSVALFAFLYGFATSARQWPPNDLLVQAWDQVTALTGEENLAAWHTSRVHDDSGVRVVDRKRMQPGFTLITSAWPTSDGTWSPGIRLLDQEGRVLHKWKVAPDEVFPDTTRHPRVPLSNADIHGTYLFPNGDVLVNVEYVGAARLDACSRVRWYNPKYNFHHSVARADDGTFWIPGVRRDVPARSEEYPDGYPGLESPIHRSLIVNLSANGEVIDTINTLDVLYKNGIQRHIPQAMYDRFEERPYGRDVVHMNDVEPLPDSLAKGYPLFEPGDLVVSLRKPNLVFVVDPGSERVKWHTVHPFIHQHDADFIGNGWIGVFDNNQDGTDRGSMLGGNRIVLLQPNTDSTEVIFPTRQSEPFYTNIRGKWQMLANGNLLLTEAQGSRVVEVGPEGQTVWEWIHEPVNDSTAASVTKATRVPLDRDQVASWPCSPGDSTENRPEVTR